MQEESEESVCREGSVLLWPCPLCQQERPDRDALAQHLTDKHSVLPACLDRLLDTATPVQVVSGNKVEESNAQNSSDSPPSQQMPSETNGAPSALPETDGNGAGPKHGLASTCTQRGSRVDSCPEEESQGEGERRPGGTRDHLGLGQESTQLPESTTTPAHKGAPQPSLSKDNGNGGLANSTSKTQSDPALEKFLDSNRPFKCNACLESFSSKSALGVHYSSSSHLHRMRTGSSMQADEKDTPSPATATPAPYLSRPFLSNKPYQCAVCRVSYNHAFTLESHLKSVLHQTRSRNATNSATSTAGNSGKKGISNLGNNSVATSPAGAGFGNSVMNLSASNTTPPGGAAATGGSGGQGSLTASSGATKDGEQSQPGAQPVSSPCPPSGPALSLLSSPVASAQAVSAFLTLLTSSGSPSVSPSVQPSLFTANAGATPQLELIAQQQLLLPLFLNGLQAQNPGASLESAGAVLTQSVPLLGLSATQQALLAQRLSAMQNQGLRPSAGLPEATRTFTEEKEKGESGTGAESVKAESREEEARGHGNTKEEELLKLKSEAVEKEISKAEGSEEDVKDLKRTLESENEERGDDKDKEEMIKASTAEDSNCVEHTGLKDSVKEEGLCKGSETLGEGVGQPNRNSSPAVHNKTAASGDVGSPSSSPRTHSDFCHSPDSKPVTSSVELKPGSTKSLNANHGVNPNDSIPTCLRGPGPASVGPVLSEFQSQVLWAFLESRSEADAASPTREDCEALGREVGLSEQQVRRWLEEARESRLKGTAHKAAPRETAEEDEEEEGVLTIVETEGGESPTSGGRQAVDLSRSARRKGGKGQGRESSGEPCLTSDSENDGDGFYTSVIVTDEESQGCPAREGPGSPAREEAPAEKEKGRGGKVLRSCTVFLSDAEDTEEDEEGGGAQRKRKRNRELEREETEPKRERQDPDVDLELEAQADPPVAVPFDQQSIPGVVSGSILHPLPVSISLAPYATQFLNPYMLSIPPSAIGLGIAEGDGDRDRGRASAFPNPPAITRCSVAFPDPLGGPPPASHVSPVPSLSNGPVCESALDLSMGKKSSSALSSGTYASSKTPARNDPKHEGLRSPALGVPGAGGLIVVRVKPDAALAVPTPNNSVGSNNNARTSTVYIRAAERMNASLVEKERGKQQQEKEKEREQKPAKARRFRDMRRSRTIIQTEQLDVLYGCYFKDPNPGKHEFQRISEWVHLPKKVVQIWFQNMRARERKGEVRFISDGTLAAMGKPLIKFTWPLTLPIFSSSPSPNSSPLSGNGTAGEQAGAGPKPPGAGPKPPAAPKPKPPQEAEPGAEKEGSRLKECGSGTGVSRPAKPKPKPETPSPAAPTRTSGKAVPTAPDVPIVIMRTRVPEPHSSQKRKRGGGDGEERTDNDNEQRSREKVGPGAANRMVPKVSATPASKPLAASSHKRNGLNDWTPKGSFKINTLSREQLGLSAPRPSGTPAPSNASVAKSGPQEGAYHQHSSSPRRPRTHLTSLQVSIMQSCYETCPHPNALECETMGTELGLPLKVVQIWFQNTRAKEKRWRLQQQKQSPGTDSSKKVDTSSGSFLLYSALRANRPILPKPVQLTVLEPSTPPAAGQPASRETLRGRCDACGVGFESRAAGRTHVFSPQHLAKLKSTNFGHPPSLVNSGSGTGSSSGSGAAAQSSPSPASSTS
ncbi:zinc finger homeobox protein 3-like [Megalops cyprinoides]|uniref:zinc finger homeobox protein 3-like n=1 Tax=Megalops cyprinoides TaxID=118141 RepID=UPI0018643F97|nr:zinc finger homeobox protein 3-like [Megalops cyprinoides]